MCSLLLIAPRLVDLNVTYPLLSWVLFNCGLMVFNTESCLPPPYMLAWRVGLSLWMIGRKIFRGMKKLFRGCRNYCFNCTTLSHARRNKPEIILTGGREEKWVWTERREWMPRGIRGRGRQVRGRGLKVRRGEARKRDRHREVGRECCRSMQWVEIPRLSWTAALNFNKGANVKWHFRRKAWGGRVPVNLLLDSCGCQSQSDVW